MIRERLAAENRQLRASLAKAEQAVRKALHFLELPGDGRDAAHMTLKAYLAMAAHTALIPPSAEEWEAAVRKAEGEA